MTGNLVSAFHTHATAEPGRLAVSLPDGDLSYGELARAAQAVAGRLSAAGGRGRVGLLAARSMEAFAGVIGAAWAGRAFVPLGIDWPEDRLIAVVAQCELDALVADRAGARALTPRVLAACRAQVLARDGGTWPAPAGDLAPASVRPDDAAYVIFTSGTTGVPKGVEISVGSLRHLLATVRELYGFGRDDRMSLAFEMTFDASLFDIFSSLSAGASLHVVPAGQLVAPIKFIRDRALTVWFSTPTTIRYMGLLGALTPGAFPALRCSLFGGEALTLEAAAAWQRAAPNSLVANLYGPTEATIATHHQPFVDPAAITSERGTIAIGAPFPGTEAAILGPGPDCEFLPPGATGELALAGAQLAVGYIGAPELTAARFPILGGKRWYLTGDRACQDAAGRFHHLGRIDDQVKVRGHRVELGDVEASLRSAAGSDLVAAIAWPISGGSADGIVAFVSGTRTRPAAILAALEQRLPGYMLPSRIEVLDALPMTPHGKVDRRALAALLESPGTPST